MLGLPLLAAPALFGAVAWLARTERERAATAVPDSVAPGLRVTLPSDPADFVISAAGPGLVLLLGLLFVPPLALCLAWIVAQRRRPYQRT